MVLVLIMMLLLMASLFLVNFVLRERIKRDKTSLFQKRETVNNMSSLKFYEKVQGRDNLIEYLLGRERIWMEKNKISPGKYSIERISVKDRSGIRIAIYTLESDEVPGDTIKRRLSGVVASSYIIELVKPVKIEEEKKFLIRAEIQADFIKGNLDQSKPDSEVFLEMTVKEQ